MGLDDFKDEPSGKSDKSDSGDATDTDSDTDSGGSDSGSGGLESFNTNTDRGGSDDENNTENEITKIPDKIYRNWNTMSEKERVKAVRQHGIQDYKPSVQLDDRWSWRKIIEIECVCGKTIQFKNTGSCDRCNRTYGERGRTVIKLNESEDRKIHNNASN